MNPGSPAATATLETWLAYLEGIHSRPIDLGLERVNRVREQLGLPSSLPFPVIIVGGTNGKGSVCAMLEAILSCAGYRVGCYTSPHLLRYNERVRVRRKEVGDAELCAAFARVENARQDISLTYFEFGTLAAVSCFMAREVDAAVLEVGLGGRLDAVNVFDADCAVVTGVALDHLDYLGDDRERIGYEKAGIFRSARPAVCGDPDPPRSLLDHGASVGARLMVLGRDFGFQAEARQWCYWSGDRRRGGLPYPALRGRRQLYNAATVLTVIERLREQLPVSMAEVRRGLVEVEHPGRFQVLPGRPAVVLDVAHNPQAAGVLADNLLDMGHYENTLAVFGMLKDKDIAGVARAVAPRIDRWLVAPIDHPRGADAERLRRELLAAGVAAERLTVLPSLAEAARCAWELAGGSDRIAAFGSFHTVAEMLRQAARQRRTRIL